MRGQLDATLREKQMLINILSYKMRLDELSFQPRVELSCPGFEAGMTIWQVFHVDSLLKITT